MQETMTQAEAEEEVERRLTSTADALPDTVELGRVGGFTSPPCDKADGGDQGRVTVNKAYWLDGLPVEDNEANIELLIEHWTSHGYRVVTDSRPDDVFVSVEEEETAFRMSVQASAEGYLSLGASSPCVWPEGTPET